MQVHIPSPLRSYTHNLKLVEASGSSVKTLLEDLDHSYPGITFRIIDEQGGIRQHIKIYVNHQMIETLAIPLEGSEVIHIMCALSGG